MQSITLFHLPGSASSCSYISHVISTSLSIPFHSTAISYHIISYHIIYHAIFIYAYLTYRRNSLLVSGVRIVSSRHVSSRFIVLLTRNISNIRTDFNLLSSQASPTRVHTTTLVASTSPTLGHIREYIQVE